MIPGQIYTDTNSPGLYLFTVKFAYNLTHLQTTTS